MTDKKHQIIDLLKDCESEKDLEYVLARSLEYVRASMDLKRLQKWADEHHEKVVSDNGPSPVDSGDGDTTSATEDEISSSSISNSQNSSDEPSSQNTSSESETSETTVDIDYTKIAHKVLLSHIIDQLPKAAKLEDKFYTYIEDNSPYETYEDVNKTYNLLINAIGEIFYEEHDERFNENNEESLYINESDTSLVTYLSKEHKLSKEAKQNFEELYIE